jgi:xylulokinase
MHLLGIDLGTTTCRAAIFDLFGNEVAFARRETPVAYPQPLWAEANPEIWWEGVCQVIREAVTAGPIPPDSIVGVGLSGLMHAPVLLDESGALVAPAMLWMDQRCAPQVEAIQRELRETAPVARLRVSSTVSAPKLRWLAEEQPAVLDRARHFILPKDFIRYRLTGRLGSEVTDAGGTGLFDRERNDWDWSVVEAARVPRRLLPALADPPTLAGWITADAARATGLAPGTPVAFGGCDTYCTRLGIGRLGPGEVCLYLGTAAVLSVVGGQRADGSATFRGFGVTATTGASLRWARDLISPDDTTTAGYGKLTTLAAAVAPGAEGLFFLPHLMGERGPVHDPLARGALVGLTLRHGRPQVVRAVLEGTAFQLRRVLDAHLADGRSLGHGLTAGVACGGAARSALWAQIIANVIGLVVRVPVVVEAAALGAAILGGVAAEVIRLDEAPARMVRLAHVIEPEPAAVATYNRLYADYCQLDELLAPWYHRGVGG